MAALSNWTREAKAHWKEHLPKMYREYVNKGILQQKLQEAAEMTFEEVYQLEREGLTPHEAWEMIREKYLFLPEETTATED